MKLIAYIGEKSEIYSFFIIDISIYVSKTSIHTVRLVYYNCDEWLKGYVFGKSLCADSEDSVFK